MGGGPRVHIQHTRVLSPCGAEPWRVNGWTGGALRPAVSPRSPGKVPWEVVATWKRVSSPLRCVLLGPSLSPPVPAMGDGVFPPWSTPGKAAKVHRSGEWQSGLGLLSGPAFHAAHELNV